MFKRNGIRIGDDVLCDPNCRLSTRDQVRVHAGPCVGSRGFVGAGTEGKRTKAAWKRAGRHGSLKSYRRAA